MKKILPLFLLIVYISNAGLKFDYQRLDMHYDGLVFNNNYIFFYGANNSIARTDLNNENWELIKIINEETDIIKIRNEDSGFYGISEQSVFRLNSEGKPLNTKSFEAVSEFKDVIKLDNNFLILNENSIDILDNDFEKINSVFFNENIVTTKMELFNDNLIVGTTNGSLYSFVNGIDNQPEIFDFVEKGLIDSSSNVSNFKINNNYLFFSLNNKIYKTTDMSSFEEIISHSNNYNVIKDTLFCLKFDQKNIGAVNDQIKFYRNIDNNIEQISNPNLKRYFDLIISTGFEFITPDIIFAFGFDNLILKSSDGGINWNVVSYYKPGLDIHWVNNQTAYNSNISGVVYKTTNGGITWKSQKKMDFDIKNWAFDYCSYFDDSGKGVLFGSLTQKGYPNVLYTNDSGNTFDTTYIEELGHYSFSSYEAPLIKHGSDYKLFYAGNYNNWSYTLLFTISDDFKYAKKERIDSLHFWVIKKYNNHYYALVRDMRHDDGQEPDTCVYHILKSIDPGINWDTVVTMRTLDTIIHYMDVIDGYAYLGGIYWTGREDTSSYHVLYLVNIDNRSHKLLKFDNMGAYNSFFKYRNDIVTGAKNGIMICSDIKKDPWNWDLKSIPGQTIWFIKGFFDNTMYAYTLDRHFLKFTFHEDTPVEESGAEVIKMFNYPPYPQPANNHVSTEIYWDSRYDMQNATITVHDYTGKTIRKPGEISVNKMNVYHGEIIWDCSSVSSGVYFINIRLGGTTRTVPVVVGR